MPPADPVRFSVGTETQILTPEIYRKTDQNKYAALVTEIDDEGKAYVPAFYGGRIFIDFSDPDKEEDAYEELTRWINDAPLHTRPKLGKKPSYLSNDEAPLATTSRFRRAKEGLERGSPGASGLIRDFGDGLTEQLIALRPSQTNGQSDAVPTDEVVVMAANAMRPYIKQLHDLTRSIARFTPSALDDLLSILEQVLSTTGRDPRTDLWTSAAFDANKMMAYEAFLGVIAVLLVERQTDLIARALDHAYYYNDLIGSRSRSTRDFNAFSQYAETLQHRNHRLNQNRADWQADFIHEHYQTGTPSFTKMMEADLLLFVRLHVNDPGRSISWFPHTLIYSGYQNFAHELFARMESATFFASISQKLFDSVSAEDFKERVKALNGARLWRGVYPGPNIGTLAGVEHIASRR